MQDNSHFNMIHSISRRSSYFVTFFSGVTNDQSKEKFHSPPNSVDTFSMRPIHTPSLVEFCLYIILCNVDCIGGKLSQGGRKKSRLEKPFLAACWQWVAKGEQKCTRIEQGIIAKNTAIIVLSLKERTFKIIIYWLMTKLAQSPRS